MDGIYVPEDGSMFGLVAAAPGRPARESSRTRPWCLRVGVRGRGGGVEAALGVATCEVRAPVAAAGRHAAPLDLDLRLLAGFFRRRPPAFHVER